MERKDSTTIRFTTWKKGKRNMKLYIIMSGQAKRNERLLQRLVLGASPFSFCIYGRKQGVFVVGVSLILTKVVGDGEVG